MKKLLVLCVLLLPFLGHTQNYTSNWDGYFSFFHITDLVAGNGKLYAATENAIFTTEFGSTYQKKITTLQGLSGASISAIGYSKPYNTLLIGYKNGLLQLYNLDQELTTTYIDIREKHTLTPEEKQINGFYLKGGAVLIATNYGISAFDLANLEFGDTYYIGNQGQKLAVNAVTVLNQRIYAATQGGGIRSILANNPNIIDYNAWQQLSSGNYQTVLAFNNQLIALTSSGTLQQFNAGNWQNVRNFPAPVNDITATAAYLTVSLGTQIQVFDHQLTNIANYAPNQIERAFTTAIVHQGTLYVGDQKFGLLKTSLSNPIGINFLSPNGPLRNDVFAMDLVQNELWLAYGGYNYYYNPYPLREKGLSHYKNNYWTNLPYFSLPEVRSIVSVTINPQQPTQVFFGSYRDGLLQVNKNEVEELYTVENSNLPHTANPNAAPDAIRIGPAKFDRQGNLWLANALSEDGLIKLPKGGGNNSFVKYDITDVIQEPGLNNGFSALVIDNSGNIFIGSYRDGIIAFNRRTEKFAKLNGGENQANLPSNYISALALDQNNQLWIGTNKGLRVLYGPSRIFKTPNIETNNIVFLDENGVARELFSGLSITDIAVDGNNNKWVASTAGAYYVSADGQKTFYHFTTENSPLPSNNINAIQINGNSGLVYFATEKGLVAFNGGATASADNLEQVRAYPNPVRPGYTGRVTIDGLMEDADVKITDIEGNLVYEEVAEGGSIHWDTRAFGQYKVASGVYFVMVTSADQTKTKVTKIMIIR